MNLFAGGCQVCHINNSMWKRDVNFIGCCCYLLPIIIWVDFVRPFPLSQSISLRSAMMYTAGSSVLFQTVTGRMGLTRGTMADTPTRRMRGPGEGCQLPGLPPLVRGDNANGIT